MKKPIAHSYSVSQIRSLYNLYNIMYDKDDTDESNLYVKKNVDELFNVLRLYDPYFNDLILKKQKLEYSINDVVFENEKGIIRYFKVLYYKRKLNKVNSEIVSVNVKPRNNRFDDTLVDISLYSISD